MIKLILFGTSGCHLCEEAELIISQLDNKKVNTEIIDIAEHTQWQEKYAIRIPVLYHAKTQKELGWIFNHEQVQDLVTDILKNQ